MFDIIIIGGGPAGLTASIYSARAGKKVLVIEGATLGGQITSSPKVENFPGFKSISGADFGEKLYDQASALNVEFEFANVEKVSDANGGVVVETDNGTFEGLSLIVATGAKHRHLGLENEESLIGNGVGYCVVCDGEFFEGKDVAVVGGGNSAIISALYLSNICKSVKIIQNLTYLTAEKSLLDELSAKENVSVILNSVVTKLIGEDELKAVQIKTGNNISQLNIDGLFVSIGQVPQNEIVKNMVELDDFGYIKADESCLTSNPKVFVAGDCRTKKCRQLTTAVSDGTVASIMACSYVDKIKN